MFFADFVFAQNTHPFDCGFNETASGGQVQLVQNCSQTSPYFSNSNLFLPDVNAHRILIRMNFIILQKADGTGNFQENNPDHIAFLNSWVGWANALLFSAWGNSNSSSCPFRASTQIQIVPNFIFRPDPSEFFWNNENGSACPGSPGSGWYIDPLDAIINTEIASNRGINVYLTTQGQIFD